MGGWGPSGCGAFLLLLQCNPSIYGWLPCKVYVHSELECLTIIRLIGMAPPLRGSEQFKITKSEIGRLSHFWGVDFGVRNFCRFVPTIEGNPASGGYPLSSTLSPQKGVPDPGPPPGSPNLKKKRHEYGLGML